MEAADQMFHRWRFAAEAQVFRRWRLAILLQACQRQRNSRLWRAFLWQNFWWDMGCALWGWHAMTFPDHEGDSNAYDSGVSTPDSYD